MHREKLKTIGLWILTIALIAAHIFFRSQAQAETVWKEIYTRSGDCRISFPSLPQMVEQKSSWVRKACSFLMMSIFLRIANTRFACSWSLSIQNPYLRL